VRGKTTSVAFDGGATTLSEFFHELGREQFEGDARPQGVILTDCWQPEQLKVCVEVL
jgi:hypothetical protein